MTDSAAEDDMVAAEFVLGSLAPEERAAAKVRLAEEPQFAAAVAEWERRLAPLIHREPGLEPPPGALSNILQSIRQQKPASNGELQTVIALRRRLHRWQWAASTFAAAAAILLLVLGWQFLRYQPSDTVVAVLAEGMMNSADEPAASADPVFLASYQQRSHQLIVRQIGGRKPMAPRDYVLWLTSGGDKPMKPLGMIPSNGLVLTLGSEDQTLLSLSEARFLVSLEITGQDPGDKPKGPIVSSGKLMNTMKNDGLR